MANFFDRMLGRNNKEGSSAVAKSRLQVVLVHDRINLPPERLREMQEEILAVIARYVPVNPDEIAIMLEQPDRNSGRLVAQIPFGKGKYPAETDFSTYTEDDDLESSEPDAVEQKLTPSLLEEPEDKENSQEEFPQDSDESSPAADLSEPPPNPPNDPQDEKLDS